MLSIYRASIPRIRARRSRIPNLPHLWLVKRNSAVTPTAIANTSDCINYTHSPTINTNTNSPSLLSLASQISSLAAQIQTYLSTTSHPLPSFNAFSPPVPGTPTYESLRVPLNEAALDLLRLVNGPKTTLRSLLCSHYDLAAFQVALEKGFFGYVPLGDEPKQVGEAVGAKAGVIGKRDGE